LIVFIPKNYVIQLPALENHDSSYSGPIQLQYGLAQANRG